MPSPSDNTRLLWLVCHGETSWDAMGRVQGQIDRARVTRNGRRQARALADRLADEPVDLVCSSDLHRARRTATVIANRLGCPLRSEPGLRERCFGMAEGLPLASLPSTVSGIGDGSVVDEEARAPGGESLRDVSVRCSTFLAQVLGRPAEGNIVVVAHGAIVRTLRALVNQAELRGMEWHPVPPASIDRLVLSTPTLSGAAG